MSKWVVNQVVREQIIWCVYFSVQGKWADMTAAGWGKENGWWWWTELWAAEAAACNVAATSNFSLCINSSLFFICLRSFALRFWNQIFTWKTFFSNSWMLKTKKNSLDVLTNWGLELIPPFDVSWCIDCNETPFPILNADGRCRQHDTCLSFLFDLKIEKNTWERIVSSTRNDIFVKSFTRSETSRELEMTSTVKK